MNAAAINLLAIEDAKEHGLLLPGVAYTMTEVRSLVAAFDEEEAAAEARWEAQVEAFYEGVFHVGPTEDEERMAAGFLPVWR